MANIHIVSDRWGFTQLQQVFFFTGRLTSRTVFSLVLSSCSFSILTQQIWSRNTYKKAKKKYCRYKKGLHTVRQIPAFIFHPNLIRKKHLPFCIPAKWKSPQLYSIFPTVTCILYWGFIKSILMCLCMAIKVSSQSIIRAICIVIWK